MKTKQLKQSEALQRIEVRIKFWETVEKIPDEPTILGVSAVGYNDWKNIRFIHNKVYKQNHSVLAAHQSLATGKIKTLNRDAANLRRKLGWN